MRKQFRRGLLGAVRRLPEPRDAAALDLLRAGKRLLTGQAPPRPPRAIKPARKGPQRTPLTLETRLEQAHASGRPARIKKALSQLHSTTARAADLATPDTARGTHPLAVTRGVHSTQYMIDLLPHLQSLLRTLPRGAALRVLDVGPGTGHGTALLAQLYRRSTLGYRMKVTALDIDPMYATYIKTISPHVAFVHDDVYTHDRVYDIIITSHVIEHVPDPVGFCKRLQQMARVAVFVSAPYKEPAENITKGHINIIDEKTLDDLGADEVTIMNSVTWGAFKNPPYECVIARLPGLAT